MNTYEQDLALAAELARQAEALGGRAWFVGGYVRDRLMGLENHDLDMELHGLTPRQAEGLLDTLGQRMTIGESFGIYSLRGCHLDIALPRRETLRGCGHRDFTVDVDPFIGTRQAAMRRDFTVNAMMMDVLTGQLLDPFGGQDDLANGLLRHVHSQTFVEDPLRVLRGAQFAARFGFTVAEETIALCRTMDLSHLPRERVMEELKKALLKSPRPSVFFETLRQMNALSQWFPELEALIGVAQNPVYHGEGDVWNHTMLVLDEAVRLKSRAADPLGFLMAAVSHDFGKAVCTQCIDGVLHSRGHETAGLPLAEQFVRRLSGQRQLPEYVCNLVQLHMKPFVMAAANSSVKSTNKLFDQALDPEALICIAQADNRGKRTEQPYVPREEFLYQRLALYREMVSRPCVTGRDLIAAGLAPGEQFSALLEFGHKLLLAGVPKEQALRQVLAEAEQAIRKNR